MFASRFTKKNLALSSDQDSYANRIYGNSRQGRLKTWQDGSQDQLDSTNVIRQQQPLSRRSLDVQRQNRNTYNRKTNFNMTIKKQTAVRQADSQVYQRNNPKSVSNKQLTLQPEVIGTSTFQPSPRTRPDTNSPLNSPVNIRRRLSNVSEQPSEQSSSFCIINQGNLPKSMAIDHLHVGQREYSSFSLEPDNDLKVIDYCTYCSNKKNFTPATHHCSSCGPFGRYLCQNCLGPHNAFTENHNVESLSGHSFKKQNQESSDRSFKETEKSEVPSIEQHQSFMKDVSQNKIKAISGKQNQESSDNSFKETEKSEVPSIEQHQSFIKDVSVKTEDDEQSCQITGLCQLQNGTIVLTEMNNKAIKALDSGTYQVTSTYNLSNYPMDICCMEGSEALVVLYKSTIQYISIDPDDHIELTRKKVLTHDCICLAYCNRKIYVGSSTRLYIYDTKWVKIDEITNDLFGDDRIFSDQFSIAVSESDDLNTIYIAEENNGMFAIEITGQEVAMTWKFKDCQVFKASGLCLDTAGNVLLCDKGSERLIKMNREGMILGILLDSSSEIQTLNIPFHDKKNNNVIISLSGKDFIKVFNFK